MFPRILILALSFSVFTQVGVSLAQSPAAPARAAVAPVAPAAAPQALPKARPLPFQGVVDRVNKTAMTFTIKTKAGKEHLFHITPETKIEKADGAATIDDIVRDEVVRGSRIKLAENKWEAKKVIIGAKDPGAEPAQRKQK